MRYIKEYKSESYEKGDYVLAYRGKLYYAKIIEKDVNYVDMQGDWGHHGEKHIEYLLVGYDVISGKNIGIQVREKDNEQNTIIRKLKPNEIEEYKMFDNIKKYNL